MKIEKLIQHTIALEKQEVGLYYLVRDLQLKLNELIDAFNNHLDEQTKRNAIDDLAYDMINERLDKMEDEKEEEIEFLNCAFCDSKEIFVMTSSTDNYTYCDQCAAQGPEGATREEVIKFWNTRK